MNSFGYIVTRDLTDAERTELGDKLAALGASYAVPAPGGDGAQPPMAPPVGNLLQGWIPSGSVEIRWSDGVPIEARYTYDHNDRADVPLAFWQDVMQYAHQDHWVQFAYIAFPESRYDEHAKVMDTNGKYARGYMQVNGVNEAYDNDSMLFGANNIRAAEDIYQQQGFGAWYNSAKMLGLIA